MILDLCDKYCNQYKLSDFHIREDKKMVIRVDGDIQTMDEVISKQELYDLFNNSISSKQKDIFDEYKNVDLSITYNNRRFRANFFMTNKGLALVMRLLDDEILPISDLGLPDIFETILEQKNGLILITGPTGSGKSTTLASMINKINQTKPFNIITIEDPIEYLHTDKQSIVVQREVGKDAYSFANALRAALREDPDVILVGELRDLETIQLALTAAETGHLVFGTLHTSGAASTINRIIDVFPPTQQKQVRSQLAQSLKFVATQQLLKKTTGGRCVAVEVMVCNTSIQNLIREEKIHQINNTIQISKAEGMITMEKSLEQLQDLGIIQ
jgi:twitching motility protein PilT